jgi:hypothetical protein
LISAGPQSPENLNAPGEERFYEKRRAAAGNLANVS